MRRTFTAEEKASVFELWKNGTGFSEIANILGSKPGTIFTMLRDTGGIKPHERKRAVAHLTLSEREEIRAGLSAKMSIRAIATALNRSPSTISREVQRNRGRRYYKAVDANNRANRMAEKAKTVLTGSNLPLRKLVLEKLEMKWSPRANIRMVKANKTSAFTEYVRNNRLPEPVIRVKQPALARFSPDVSPLFVHFRADDDVTARLYARGYRLRPEFLSDVKSC
ncbi:IS30 transposase [Escherichia coli]|nr:IS30 transposase [Escherichia coli]